MIRADFFKFIRQLFFSICRYFVGLFVLNILDLFHASLHFWGLRNFFPFLYLLWFISSFSLSVIHSLYIYCFTLGFHFPFSLLYKFFFLLFSFLFSSSLFFYFLFFFGCICFIYFSQGLFVIFSCYSLGCTTEMRKHRSFMGTTKFTP